MKAIVQEGFGGVEVLSYKEVADPILGPREALVKVEAAALNHLDVLQRRGPAMLPGFTLPHIAGMDVAGTVVAVGSDAACEVGSRVVVDPAVACGRCRWCRSGDDGQCQSVRVIGATRPGGYAELCAVPEDHVYGLPPGIDFDEAATIPTAFATAWHSLVTVGRLRAGETLLVHGAGSGVTIAAVQLAKRLGARVIATSRSEKKLAVAAGLGADVVLSSAHTDLAAVCRDLSGGDGVDVVLDHVGPALFDESLHALRPHGRLLFVGTTTGTRAEIDLPYAYHFGIALYGVDPYCASEFGEMLDFYWKGGFTPVIDSAFPLGQAPTAPDRLESGGATGKILLHP